MDKLRKTRISIRISIMVAGVLVLAFMPQLLIERLVLRAFYLDNTSQNIAAAYKQLSYWAHCGGMLALLVANLLFFKVNETKGETGKKLHNRIVLQNWTNFLLICAGIGAMTIARYSIVSDVLIGNYIAENIYIILRAALPYIVLTICGVIIWSVCVRCIPATNVPLRCKLAAYWDEKLQKIKN